MYQHIIPVVALRRPFGRNRLLRNETITKRTFVLTVINWLLTLVSVSRGICHLTIVNNKFINSISFCGFYEVSNTLRKCAEWCNYIVVRAPNC